MGGLVGTGMGYSQNALNGFNRVSAQEQQRESTNRQLDAAATQQEISMGVSAASLIAMLAIAL